MTPVTGFPPVINPSATTLILGSIPGIASLDAVQYYAHPRNAFWSIMEAIYDIDQALSYDDRIIALQQTNIALWDVFQQCHRQGSLDSAIKQTSSQPNDFLPFFEQHPLINHIVFNGQTASKAFMQTVIPQINGRQLSFFTAPSTSPAHAIPLAKKIEAWRIGLNF